MPDSNAVLVGFPCACRLIRWLLLTLSVCAAAGAVAVAQDRVAPAGDGVSAGAQLVAVAPFENISADPADRWIGAGIAETVAADLEQLEGVSVIGREAFVAATGSPRVSDADAPARARSRDLGATWLVTGGYQRVGDQLRITARVIDVETGAVTGRAALDGAVGELFALQDRIVAQLVGATGAGFDRSDPAVVVEMPVRLPLGEARAGDPGQGAGAPPPVVSARSGSSLGGIDGPPAPTPPAVVTRDQQGGATLRAVRVREPMRLDGRLDEPVYQAVQAITGFIQQVPDEGAAATEKTEAWILFDDENIYVGARVWDSAPPSEWVANEMRRDANQLRQNDNFVVLFDTFYDRRNGVGFQTTPLGALSDFAITNEGSYNGDWNPVWDVRTGRFDGGWTVEMEIPFKSLRYRPGPDQLWGIQMRRGIRRKTEYAYITPLPISAAGGAGGTAGIFRISAAATLVGLEVPGGSRNLEIKPYAIGRRTTDLNASPPKFGDGDGDFGVDLKYGITRNLTADVTYNTDFAQVEVDEQQVNLTRFSLFFPEKREFFLEGRGIFDFARGGFGGGGALRSSGGFFGGGNAPTLFYTRRIGLENGAIVPIVAGGRVTGKVGAFDVGGLNIQTDAEEVSGAEMTNFTVVRVKRDLLRRSSVGALFTNRSVSLSGDGMSQAYGADATFSFFENVSFLGYLARTRVPGVETEDQSYQGRFDYGGDLYGFQADHLVVERNFVPEVGFVRRDNFRRSFASGRFSPRPSSLESVRQFRFEGSFDYILTADTGIVETRQSQLGFAAEFENSDTIGVSVADNYEFLIEPFSPGPGVTLPIGGYGFRDLEASYTRGSQHAINGTITARVGEYFNGDIRSIGFSRARVELTPQFTVEPSVSVNWIDTPAGSFRADLIVSRVTYTLTPRMFVSGLAQYNSNTDAISNNFRLRWEYTPGSELFVVYSEDRNTNPLMPNRFSELRNRGFVVKVNRLFRF